MIESRESSTVQAQGIPTEQTPSPLPDELITLRPVAMTFVLCAPSLCLSWVGEKGSHSVTQDENQGVTWDSFCPFSFMPHTGPSPKSSFLLTFPKTLVPPRP